MASILPNTLSKVSIKRFLQPTVQRVWDIDGYPNYFFGHDKQLYRYDRRGQLKKNKRIVIATTQGYILKRKFYSLAQLRPLLDRHNVTGRPEGF